MGRPRIHEAYTCENCLYKSGGKACDGCKPLSKITSVPKGWEPMDRKIPERFDATAFLRAMKGHPITMEGINLALRKMIDNLEVQRMPYYTITRVHQFRDNVPAVYIDDGKKSLVVILLADECGICTGKL